jgi:hypothetical protein
MIIQEKKIIDSKDIINTMETVAQFEWSAFLRWIIVLILLFIFSLVILYLFIRLKRKTNFKEDKKEIDNIISDIPTIINIVEKMKDIQQETVYRIMGYISQARLEIIVKRYARGFILFCEINCGKDDEISKEFDCLIDDISHEVVEKNVYKEYMRQSRLLVDIHTMLKNEDCSFYSLEKRIIFVIQQAIGEAIKTSKKVSYVEVMQ